MQDPLLKSAIPIWKPQGMTPLDAVRAFKKNFEKYKHEKVSYAGRLDPMAEGILLLLVGDVNKKRKEYENSDKKYDAEIVLGISTDTYDGMGLIQTIRGTSRIENDKVQSAIKSIIGTYEQEYPPYSSRTVQGKPLYWWARKNRLGEIRIPKKRVKIYSIENVVASEITGGELSDSIIRHVEKVRGDFRQKEIINEWKCFSKKHADEEFVTIRFGAAVSSGTYIRGVAHDVGKRLDVGAFLLSLKRTQIGEISQNDCVIINT